MFESSVISYDSKTRAKLHSERRWFESSVISYDSKTILIQCKVMFMFEGSVISYDSKTEGKLRELLDGLRVV